MQGQHKSSIQSFYDQCIQKAKEYLESMYPLEHCSKTDKDYPEHLSGDSWIVWKLKIQNDLYPLTYILAIPDSFPDKLPEIYLSKKDHSAIAPIPHVHNNRLVCTRDPNIVSINEEKPGEAVKELLEIATEEIINTGIRKENMEHFVDEFLAYWNDGVKLRILSLIKPRESIEKLKIVQLKKEFLQCKYILVQSEKEAHDWLSPLEIEIDSSFTVESLYLPLESPILPPQKTLDYYKIVKQAGDNGLSAVKEYFRQRESDVFIFFSFPLRGERILAGWKQAIPKSIAGFRPWKIPFDLRFRKSTIKKIRVERIDKDRLFKRGGTGIRPSVSDSAVAVVGCGSLGSSLTISLSKTGISKFLLVDEECIEVENVARHECGFVEAGLRIPKSLAMKERITKHFPYIHCENYDDDILSLLRKEESMLNSYDLVVVAIANLSVERRLNTLLRQGIITSPLLFLWLEPFGVAGHILFIHPEKGGCYQCCLEGSGEFRYCVAKANQDLFKTEAGCQSTFVQYSNLDMEHFMIVATKKIVAFLEGPPPSSILHTWLGDLSLFETLGYKIRDEWLADSSFSIHKRIIQKNENCKICQSR